MKTIQLEYYEINDLTRLLEYTLKKKKDDFDKGSINEYMYKMDKNIINTILSKISKSNNNQKANVDILKIM